MQDLEYYQKISELIRGHQKEKNLKKVPYPMRTQLSNELRKLQKTTKQKIAKCLEQNQ